MEDQQSPWVKLERLESSKGVGKFNNNNKSKLVSLVVFGLKEFNKLQVGIVNFQNPTVS